MELQIVSKFIYYFSKELPGNIEISNKRFYYLEDFPGILPSFLCLHENSRKS